MIFRNFIRLIALCAILSTPVHGQDSSTTASLNGSIRDAAGQAVVGALITLRDLATNQTRHTTSDADGNFRVSMLLVGTYEVRAEASGFASYLNPQLTVALGRTTTLEIRLRPADVSAEVTITDRLPAIDTSQTASTTSIDPERIEELPINSRNYLEFTLLAPGVAPSNPQARGGGSSSLPGAPLADSGFTFGGLRPRSNTISIDGLDNTDETTGASRVALSPEIVREFQIVNNGLSAEFGGAAGGAINVVTKTGANEFHGDAFTFFQNERFNARNPFSDPASSRPRFRRSQPGGALGGPLKRDRAFFYIALEQEHLTAEDESEIDRATRTRINSLLATGFAPHLAVRSLSARHFPVGADETEAAGKLTYLAASRHTVDFRFAFTNVRGRGDAFNNDSFSDQTARGSAYTKDYQLTGSIISVLSPHLVNDLRLQGSTRKVVTRSNDPTGSGIEIVGRARFGRSPDADSARRETREQFVDNISLSRARSEWKTGATLNRVSLRDDASEGFRGLFIFRTLDDFANGRPALWRQAFGNSHTRFSVTSFGAFLQNQLGLASGLTLNLGARYDVEHLPSPFRTDKNNLSPRLGLAFSLSNKWVVRAGFGLYYDRLPLAFLNRALQKNGVQAFEQVATDEEAARAFVATGGGRALNPSAAISPSIFRADPHFATPYSLQTNVGVERLLSTNVTLRAGYLFTRGIHLPRTRNINLLPPVVLTAANASALVLPAPTPQQLGRAIFGPGRLDPRFDAIYQLENSASSTYTGLTLELNKRLSDEFELLASYTFSKTIDDASDFDEQPANPYDLRMELALSRQDVRQRFVVSALFDLPFEDEEKGAKNDSLPGAILEHIEIAPIVTFSSGRPANALTGADEELSRASPLASRPLGFERNSLHTPRFFNVDVRALKYFPFGERRRLDLVVEFFNLLNHPNVVSINPFFGSDAQPFSTFGAPTAFASPRQLRFSIDFEF